MARKQTKLNIQWPRRFLRGIAVAAFWLALWQVVAVAVHEEVLLVGPLDVLLRLGELVRTATFWATVAASMGRVVMGFALGVAAGVLLAAATSVSRLCDALFRPILSVVKATPIASFIILALVWLKGARVPTFAAFLVVLPIVWQNVRNGIAQTPRTLLEMAAVYRFGPRRTLTQLYVPAVLPYFMAACRTGLGMAWKAGVAAEVLASARLSIGGNLYDAKIYLETPDLFAWTVVVILLSMALEKVLVALMRRLSSRARGGPLRIREL